MDKIKRVPRLIYKKGAEANLYLHCWHGKNVLVKERISKAYRDKKLDSTLRRKRTRQEAKLLTDARRVGVPTPSIFLVDIVKIGHRREIYRS